MAKDYVITDAIRRELTAIVETAVEKALAKGSVKDAYMNTQEVMQTLSISRPTLWRMCKAGTIHPKHGTGKQLLFAVSEVKALIKDATNE